MMNIMHSTSSFLSLKPSPLLLPPCYPQTRLHPCHSVKFPLTSPNFTYTFRSSIGAAIPSNEGTVSVVEFEDFVEKDWSFLDSNDTNSDHMQKIDRIISAGEIAETSKVMVSIGSEAFVDRVVNSSPCDQLLIVHDSLFVLACIKEKYDKVKCWQGELVNVPEKWTAFDVVFLYFLPALPFELDQVLAALSKRCSPGARLVISHPQGRQVVAEQKQLYPDVVVSNLPDNTKLQSVAANHSFEVVEFEDKPGFYLAVLRLDAKSEK